MARPVGVLDNVVCPRLHRAVSGKAGSIAANGTIIMLGELEKVFWPEKLRRICSRYR
jgi:hypothetical protein